MTNTPDSRRTLDSEQQRQYREEGYLILRGAIDDAEIKRLERGFERNPPLDGTLEVLDYPAPGRYTLANSCLKDPDLAFLAEHPVILAGAEILLGDQPKLTAYVIYDRTPGGPGIPAHHDYKRWRPVGSSMNWLFTIVPFCDYDQATGQLFIAPGSHHLERISDSENSPQPSEVAPAIKPSDAEFIDPQLKRGDLLFMNMHLWHKAAGNQSNQHRVGAFNKYAAVSCPPATGFYLYDDDVANALTPDGRSILGVHSNKSIDTTRALLTRQQGQSTEVLMVETDAGWTFPGGRTFVEQAIPDWDEGNFIASLNENLRTNLRIETPWATYVGDYDENDHLCRVYAYPLNDHGFPVKYQGRWIDANQVGDLGCFGWEQHALDAWLDPNVVRGKGLAQAQCRIDQFAY